MRWLLPLASSVLTSDLQDRVSRTKRAIWFWIVIGVFGATAYAFAAVAAFLWLAESRTPLEAAVILAVGSVLLAAAAVAGLSIANTVARRREARRHAELQAQLAVAMSALPLVLRSKPVMIAAAIGSLVFLSTIKGKPDTD